MRVNIVKPQDLSDNHLTEWRRLQRLDPQLESPYLCPDFIQVAAQIRDGIVVAVAEEGGHPVAFLPMQLRGKTAVPVCCPLSDCQAIIAAHGWDGDPRDMIRAAGVDVYDFKHHRIQPTIQQPLTPYHRAVVPSRVIELSAGFDAYVAEMRVPGQTESSGRPHQTIKRARLAERKVGPLRFTMHDPDKDALATLIKWKRQQYDQRGKVLRLIDIFSYDWTVQLLERIHAAQSDNFAGVLSTLRIGDRIIAAHMGMRSHNVLHRWFPAYDKAYSNLSPGLILLLELCRSASTSGIREIELGPGDEVYKRLIANNQIMVASGFVGSSPSTSLWRRQLLHGTDTLANRLPIGSLRTWPGRLFRRMDRAKWLRA
jgi:CelD/BcsL family acetyltransferase involved in cellulose biosynthesis